MPAGDAVVSRHPGVAADGVAQRSAAVPAFPGDLAGVWASSRELRETVGASLLAAEDALGGGGGAEGGEEGVGGGAGCG